MQLEEQIEEPKTKTRNFVGPYHPSCLQISKGHSINHLVNALKRLGRIKYHDVGSFDSSHTRFEKSYKNASKKRRTAIDKVMARNAVSSCLESAWPSATRT